MTIIIVKNKQKLNNVYLDRFKNCLHAVLKQNAEDSLFNACRWADNS